VKFRPDIEGLRGIAVALVVLSHAGSPGFSGGFIGVDVFFVISGYLITGLLTQELARTGRIDYRDFYARRVRRLAPALVAMVVAVCALSMAVLSGEILSLQLRTAFWALLWSSNFHFVFAHFDYFGVAAQQSLFLHTWSLGVEEQFYLVWPVLLALAWRRWGAGFGWLAWLTLLSFGGSLAWMAVDALGAYYLMPARLWQLALGALAYRVLEQRGPGADPRIGPWLGWAGLALLLASLVMIDGTRAYPGAWGLLPALASVLLLAAGATGAGPVTRLLSGRGLRLPGRISYSWYLWHWPVLMAVPLVAPWPLRGWQTGGLVLVSFLLGWLSHRLVEQPFRRSGKASSRDVVVAGVCVSLGLAAMLHLAAESGLRRLQPAAAGAGLAQTVAALVTLPAVYSDKRCDQWYSSSELVPCDQAVGPGQQGRIVLLGDSVGTQWSPALEAIARSRGMQLRVLTKSSCPIVDEPFVYGRLNRRFTECEHWREQALAHIEAIRPDIVVIGSTSGYDFSARQWREGSRRIVERLSAAAGAVVVLAPTPMLPFNGPDCVAREGRLAAGVMEVEGCSAALAGSENAQVLEALRDAVAGVPRARLVSMNDLVCREGTCRAYRDRQLVYRDNQHINASFAASLGPAMDARLPAFPHDANR
jgi:peptidoglycan/LPS O-acetylase OafA/YrhL